MKKHDKNKDHEKPKRGYNEIQISSSVAYSEILNSFRIDCYIINFNIMLFIFVRVI